MTEATTHDGTASAGTGLRRPLPLLDIRSAPGRADVGDRAWSPDSVHVLAKPTGAACNLGCSYCFFLDKELYYLGDRMRMSDEVLEAYIRQLVDAHTGDEVTVAWQGGEPTLMGLDFFQRAIAVQERYRRPGMTYLNTIQTNGTLLDDEWCAFLAEHDFLVGISLDGPRALHDTFRVDKGGGPTFDRVLRGLRLLQRHGVEYNVLTTVNAINGDHPLAVYRFLRDEVGTTWMQFIPVVERLDDAGLAVAQRGSTVSERSVGAEQFGRFLIEIFDEWLHHDVGDVFVQTFEATLRNWMGMPPGMCVFDETCGRGLALEHNGDLYSCDHFVEPDHKLGNIGDASIGDLLGSAFQHRFGQDKRDRLPRYCRECDVRFACNGECPKNRFVTTPDGEPGLNYLCAGLKAFFHHVDAPMRAMAGALRAGRPASDAAGVFAQRHATLLAAVAAAGRNDPCPCGSGRKTKRCHGDAVSAGTPPVGRVPQHGPRRAAHLVARDLHEHGHA
jgi:uncharacterized protein